MSTGVAAEGIGGRSRGCAATSTTTARQLGRGHRRPPFLTLDPPMVANGRADDDRGEESLGRWWCWFTAPNPMTVLGKGLSGSAASVARR